MTQLDLRSLPRVDAAARVRRTTEGGLQLLRGGGLGAHGRRLEWTLLGFLLAGALLIRLVDLGGFPDTVLADEADNAQAAVRILHHQPPVNGFFGLDWTAQPAFSVYKEAAFLAVFGFRIAAMRLPSALISALALVPFYLLLRRQFSVPASWLTTALLATGVWYLNFSRSGWNNVDICFDMLMAAFFLLRALDAVRSSTGRPRRLTWALFAAAGAFCSLGLYGYPSGRAVTIAVAASLPVAVLFDRTHGRRVLAGYLVLFAVEAALFAPQGAFVARNWAAFNGRTKVVSLLNSQDFRSHPAGTVLAQLGRNVRAPWVGAVNNTGQYTPVDEPQLDRVTGALVLAGMLLTLLLGSLRRRPETWIWWLLLLSGWVATQVLTTDSPNGARGIGYLPALVYFAAVSMDTVAGGLRALARRPAMRRPAAGAAAALVAAVLAVAVTNVLHYVDWQREPQTRGARYLYVTAREFPAWSAEITNRAANGSNELNVGEWRAAHPIADLQHPS